MSEQVYQPILVTKNPEHVVLFCKAVQGDQSACQQFASAIFSGHQQQPHSCEHPPCLCHHCEKIGRDQVVQDA